MVLSPTRPPLKRLRTNVESDVVEGTPASKADDEEAHEELTLAILAGDKDIVLPTVTDEMGEPPLTQSLIEWVLKRDCKHSADIAEMQRNLRHVIDLRGQARRRDSWRSLAMVCPLYTENRLINGFALNLLKAILASEMKQGRVVDSAVLEAVLAAEDTTPFMITLANEARGLARAADDEFRHELRIRSWSSSGSDLGSWDPAWDLDD